MDTNVWLIIAIVAAAVAVIFYLKKHGTNVAQAVQQAAADVKSHVAGVTSAQTLDIQQTNAQLAARVAPKPAPPVAGEKSIDPPLSPAAASPPAATPSASSSDGNRAPDAAGVSSAPPTPIAPAAAPAAPIAPLYAPNGMSNTPDWRKWTDTTPEGYPIQYAITTDAAGNKVVDLSRGYSVFYDGAWMPPGEVAVHRAEVIARENALAQASNVAPGRGTYPVSALDDEAKKYLYASSLLPGKNGVEFAVLSGDGAAINAAINRGGMLAGGSYDPKTFAGDSILIALVDAYHP